MPEPTIRPEDPADHPAIRAVVAAAFESDTEADLVEAIRASEHYVPPLALVADDGGEIVGHTMISGALLRGPAGERPIVMLAPLAVVPARQGEGIGGALVRAAVTAADQRGEPLVVLEGSPAYYRQLGFEPAHRHGIELPLPDWAPRDAGQVVRLAAYDPALTGSVVYPPAFGG